MEENVHQWWLQNLGNLGSWIGPLLGPLTTFILMLLIIGKPGLSQKELMPLNCKWYLEFLNHIWPLGQKRQYSTTKRGKNEEENRELNFIPEFYASLQLATPFSLEKICFPVPSAYFLYQTNHTLNPCGAQPSVSCNSKLAQSLNLP